MLRTSLAPLATPCVRSLFNSDLAFWGDTAGLMVWNISDNAVAGAHKLNHLNPRTQEFTLP